MERVADWQNRDGRTVCSRGINDAADKNFGEERTGSVVNENNVGIRHTQQARAHRIATLCPAEAGQDIAMSGGIEQRAALLYRVLAEDDNDYVNRGMAPEALS